MSGRGKGNKRLGKEGAKRRYEVLQDDIQGITKPAVHRLAHRGSVKLISCLIYKKTCRCSLRTSSVRLTTRQHMCEDMLRPLCLHVTLRFVGHHMNIVDSFTQFHSQTYCASYQHSNKSSALMQSQSGRH
ncbi:hypothetical protein X801_04343 [Opisthorchis viverrini]|uniref:Histone H4 n=1 Tax=Opisthorchis viverrini TaxID=6198 RepID=A0A1S8WZA3_OPIVI|nr:hypothetical protein X801_04343 [Opisthorchis viverrini]